MNEMSLIGKTTIGIAAIPIEKEVIYTHYTSRREILMPRLREI